MKNHRNITACILALAVVSGAGISYKVLQKSDNPPTNSAHIEYVSEKQSESAEQSENIPVDISVRYFLDGKEYDIDKIKGKSGHILVEFNYKNREYMRKKLTG